MISLAMIVAVWAPGAAYFLHGTLVPRSQLWGRIVCHGPRSAPSVALTFDDGPTPAGTERILDILDEARVKATFFVIGKNVEKHPQLLRRIHEAGHAIGNHTWNHDHQGWAGLRNYWEREIGRTGDLIEEIIGVRPIFFRPPVGIKTFLTLSAARRLGYATVAWSARAYDGVHTDAESILRRLSNVRGGDIVMMHDGISPHYPRDPAATIAALPQFLDHLRGRQLKAVRLDELLSIPAIG